MKSIEAQRGFVFNDIAEAAIAQVLGAERSARESVEQACSEVERIAENARRAARAVAERTERRMRAVLGAFERELVVDLAEIDAQAAALGGLQPLAPGDVEALRQAVRALAKELIGAPP
ncbi:MAG: hypothetical protein ABL900_19815 [Burkholderiaceae bacterium]